MVTDQELDKMMALGQYVHWSRLQFNSMKYAFEADCSRAELVGRMAHWLAALYVVVEGWQDLKRPDKRINEIIDTYSEFSDVLRRCRNAVYHYQKSQFDKRIECALELEELKEWATVLQDEFECFVYMYPLKGWGLSVESVELHKEYLACIGWTPENESIEWYKASMTCINYISQNSLNKLEKTIENDVLIISVWEQLQGMRDQFLQTVLSRWKLNT
ncbi:hypothetical protein ACOIWV_004530 [Vibrio parahaemolyticus]